MSGVADAAWHDLHVALSGKDVHIANTLGIHRPLIEAALRAECGVDVERLARAIPCEDPEEPCDADGRDEHRWCDHCIARAVIRRPAIAAEYARLAEADRGA